MQPPEAGAPPVKFVKVTEIEPVVPAPNAPIMGWTASLALGDGLGDGLGVGVDVALGEALSVGLALGVGEGEGLADATGDGLGALALHAGASAAKTAINATTAATDPLTIPLRRMAPPSLSHLRVTPQRHDRQNPTQRLFATLVQGNKPWRKTPRSSPTAFASTIIEQDVERVDHTHIPDSLTAMGADVRRRHSQRPCVGMPSTASSSTGIGRSFSSREL
jgi:hypothetical protein